MEGLVDGFTLLSSKGWYHGIKTQRNLCYIAAVHVGSAASGLFLLPVIFTLNWHCQV